MYALRKLFFRIVRSLSDTKRQCGTYVHRSGYSVLFFFTLALSYSATSLADRAERDGALLVSAPLERSARAEYILEKVAEADRRCSDLSLSFITEEGRSTVVVLRKGKNGKYHKHHKTIMVHRIVARPVYLCAFKESDQSWHVVKVFVRYPLPETFVKFPAWLATKGYELEHVSGRGVGRLTFALYQHGEKLTIYRYRYAWFTKNPQKDPLHEVIRTARAVNYTPYQSDFEDTGLRDVGARFLRDKIESAFADLKRSGVVSKAFPSKKVSDVINKKQPMILAAIEQTDDGRFIADPKEATNAIFIEYALNKERAFSWSVSSANAIGPLQFTNKNGDGTYDLVVRTYPEAHLMADFEDGTRDLHNVLKAAICLLDLELAHLPEVRDLYVRDPQLGGIYPTAAYNEGGGGARQLYLLIRKNDIDLSNDDIDLPESVFRRIKRFITLKKKKHHVRAKSIVNHETYLYIKKYMYVWKYLDALPAYTPEIH